MLQQTQMAFEFARCVLTQLIFLAAATVMVTAVLTPVVRHDNLSKDLPSVYWMWSAWVLYALAIISWLGALAALTGTLAQTPPDALRPSAIYAANIRTLCIAGGVLALVASILLLVYHWLLGVRLRAERRKR